jgi:hypothetical protein
MSFEDSIESLEELYLDPVGNFVDKLLLPETEERLSGNRARVITLPDHPACQPVEFFIERPKLSYKHHNNSKFQKHNNHQIYKAATHKCKFNSRLRVLFH